VTNATEVSADVAANVTADVTNPTNEAAGSAPAALRIVRGEPSPEELAALVAVLAARSAAGAGEPAPPRTASGWTDRARYVRSGRVEFGARGGWRASVLPR
jgi:Acyl-CoA carboxylase epsilon subunit